ncbi:MAG TPA: enoyl-CoA hydratase/isomerase family protein [Gemmatimonadaceae bacterium]|nr:enoyl-CoA hydratase/isomerase family protein [Gemmatimonadaceae bacterium]
MTTYTHLTVTDRDAVRTIVLNRPERLNAINPRLADELPAALGEAAAEDAVRVVVVTGAGRGFCAGLDLQEPALLDQSRRVGRLDDLGWVGRWVLAAAACEKPVIAAVNGPAAGAGFGLALAADLRLVSSAATLTTGYVRIGLSPDAGVSYHLPRLIGLGPATDLLLTGRDVAAEEALRLGLASAVLPAERFAEEVAAHAARLAAGPPVALALTKRLLRQSLDTALVAQLRDELTHVRTSFATADAREAIAAFAERRRPQFRGE